VSVSRWPERHGRAIFLLVALALVAGVVAYPSLPSGIYPSLQFPRVVVIARSGDLPPRTMMLTIALPLEQAIMEVPGIRRVRSVTFRGATEISAQFEPTTDMIVALQEVRSRVEDARADLSAQVELTVERLTPAMFPILIYDLTGGLPTADLRDYAYHVMRPALSRVPGVGRVEVLASDTREIEVVADPGRLLAAGLTVTDVAAALQATNQIEAVGRYSAGGDQHLVLVSGLWESIAEIARTPLVGGGGARLTVGDVATVYPGAPDRTLLVAANGRDAATVSISQQLGANILDVKRQVDTTLAEVGRSLPSGLTISKVYDLAEFVAAAIESVRDAILVGSALAIVVLFAFLRRWRVTFIAATTLPLTVIATFPVMRLFGESVNIMSMGGLAVAIGLVIDDAVVVVENIHRRLAAGSAAVEEATAELVAPVVGSTLTTVVVLAPLGLLTGVAGQFFRSLSLTLSAAVLISLVLALTLIPLLARLFLAPRATDAAPLTPRSPGFYARTLAVAMRRPRLTLAVAVGSGVLGGLLYLALPIGFLPQMDEGGFVVDYLSPPGTALEETDLMVKEVERLVAATPEVASFSRRTGAELGLFATQQNKGDILVRLKPAGRRSRSAAQVIDDLRARVHDAAPRLEVEFLQLLQDMIGDLEGNSTPIEVKVFGDDTAVLAAVADQVETRIAAVHGIVDLVGVQRGNPEITWKIDPAAASRIGLSVERVSGQLSAAWLGEVATHLRLLDRTLPVRVRYADADRMDPSRMGQITLRGADGSVVPLSAVGHPVESPGEPVLTRENLRQMALVTARLEERDLGGAVAEIRSRLADLALPVGFSLEVGGQQESQRLAFRQMVLVLAVAGALVFTILLVQFRAFTPAILILAAAPLSFGGAFLLLWLTGTELNVSSAMGLILLIGIVVKNGIVMIDYAHRLAGSGMPLPEALFEAAQVRLRPILMTTLCTLFGLVPLALGIGAGAEIQKPLALAVIGGLGFSTLLTLYAVPAAYAALARRGRWGL
jgi:CzcA family heavy metal efflux pump